MKGKDVSFDAVVDGALPLKPSSEGGTLKWPGEAEEADRLRDPSKAVASDEVPPINGLTMPLMDGEDTRETLEEAVAVLGDEEIWCEFSCVSMPFIGGSGRKADVVAEGATVAGCGGYSGIMDCGI